MSSNERVAAILDGVAAIVRERNGQHGAAVVQHETAAVFWATYLGVSLTAADVAVMLALLKVSRIACGDAGRADHYDDMVGYAAIARACMESGKESGIVTPAA